MSVSATPERETSRISSPLVIVPAIAVWLPLLVALAALLGSLWLSVGMGLTFVPLSSTALSGVGNHDAGVASAMVNTTQQIGGSLGVALLNTVFTTAVASYITAHGPAAAPLGIVHGYNVAFTVSAVLLAAAALTVFVLIRRNRPAGPAVPEPAGTPELAAAVA